MAQYLSADSAVNVKTETPIEISLAHSVTLHKVFPHGHDSNVYIKPEKRFLCISMHLLLPIFNLPLRGTQINITKRSARARDRM